MEATKTKILYILILLLCISITANVIQCNDKQVETETVTVVERDTIVDIIRDYDTVFVSNTVYKDRYYYDTLIVNNTIYLKDTLMDYSFSERDYDLAVKAMVLDSYKLNIHAKDTIILKETVKTKEKKYSVGIGVGIGVGAKTKNVEPFIGISITRKLF